MLFNTLTFGAFLPIVFLLYYLPPLRHFQLRVLVVASLVFYGWNAPALLFLLAASVAINAVTSYQVALSDGPRQWRWAAAGVVVNLAILGTFKYAGFLHAAYLGLLGRPDSPLYIPLPIGISFYTFEGISLLVDTLRARRSGGVRPAFVSNEPRTHLWHTSLFIVFFPHLIAGPILKARHFFPQIGPKRFRDIQWEAAIRCLIAGFFLKTVVADNLKDFTGVLAYPYYESYATTTNLALLLGYSVQIFADFAGYSLIAIGLGWLFGYELPQNFDFPYLSQSIAEFWRRWHTSLSTWLRDYLYIPLGGNRRGEVRTYVNLILVMALGGLWHGAALSYLVWGLYHGIGLAVERLIAPKAAERRVGGLVGFLRIVAVFLFATFGWLFFKLPEFGQAMGFLQALGRNAGMRLDPARVLPVVVFSLPVLAYYLWNCPTVRVWRERSRWSGVAEGLVYGVALFLILVSGGSAGEFIYFQF